MSVKLIQGYEVVIGFETHTQLATQSKIFSRASTAFGAEPNTQACAVDLALPGTLPVMNREAVACAIRLGLALGSHIAPVSIFARKNYFYPDLPKGYQISQYQYPLVRGGYLEIDLPNDPRMNSNKSRIVLKDESYRLMQLLFEVHNKLGPIYKEKNYCDAIEEVLKREKIPYERERKIVLKFENLEVSDFFADFVVDNKILLEVKAKPFITNHDIRQASRYIKSLGSLLAIIANFKRQKLESKRVINPAFENHSSSFEKDSRKKVRIQRVHLEEDTGRLIHDPKTKSTLVDFNRAGIPLMELVTEPDLRSPEEARLFAEELRMILQYLGVSDADMEKGEMRIEANVSLRPVGSDTLGTKVELKNINSFRFVERAIAYEIERQRQLLKRGEGVRQETRGWDEIRGETVSQRLKEESHDYRYFPEPDLPPLSIPPSLVEELRLRLPELPRQKLLRVTEEFGIEAKLAAAIVRNRATAGFFEAAISELREWLKSTGKDPADPTPLQLAANYLTTDITKLLTDSGTPIAESLITPENFAELITYIYEGRISSRTAKDVLREMFSTGADPSVIIDEKKLWQVSEASDLTAAVEKAIAAQSKAAADYRAGKTTALQFLLGQVMKEAKGANPEVVRKLLEEKLNARP